MKSGKAFEIFVKRVLMCVGFTEVNSDGIFVYDGAPGQMIQGLGEAHNADVLLEPPVQIPFFYKTRLLIECKDYKNKIGIDIVRSALGLREDINHFNVVELTDLEDRKSQRRNGIIKHHDRYNYQVAIASMSGFTIQAQNFAATHRIPLLNFNEMPFWNGFIEIVNGTPADNHCNMESIEENEVIVQEEDYFKIINYAEEIGREMAMAVTDSGQLLFLYQTVGDFISFDDVYSLHWENNDKGCWKLKSGRNEYIFHLPEVMLKQWISNSSNDLELKKWAIDCKYRDFSNMIVYYYDGSEPMVKMISINKDRLNEAKEALNM